MTDVVSHGLHFSSNPLRYIFTSFNMLSIWNIKLLLIQSLIADLFVETTYLAIDFVIRRWAMDDSSKDRFFLCHLVSIYSCYRSPVGGRLTHWSTMNQILDKIYTVHKLKSSLDILVIFLLQYISSKVHRHFSHIPSTVHKLKSSLDILIMFF